MDQGRLLSLIRKALRALVNIMIVFFVVVYVSSILPVIKFMGNSLKEEEKEESAIVIKKEDNIIDIGELEYMVTSTPEEPEQTPSPEPTSTPVPTISPTPDPYATSTRVPKATVTPIPTETPEPTATPAYVRDPEVEGVTKKPGSELYFESDSKNILILGYFGSCTDTMIVVSICDRTKTIQVVSLARDSYVPYTGTVKQYLLDTGLHESKGIYKLNACYEIGKMIKYEGGRFGNSGIDFTVHVIESLMASTNIHIDDYVFIESDGLVDLVDLFGGAYVYCPEDIYQVEGEEQIPYLWYQKGYHLMDGTDTLKFLRTRYRYNENGRISSTGDPYRKANQLKFIQDFAYQVVTKNNLLRINEIMNTVSEFCYHSINSTQELSEYKNFASNYINNKYTISLTVCSGSSIDPLGDKASYVNLMY